MNQAISNATPGATHFSSAAPLLLHVFSTFAVGGPQRRFVALANHFGPRFRHIVIPLDGRAEARSLLDPSLACDIQMPIARRRNPIAAIAGARRQLRAARPDLLITYNWGAMGWGAANLSEPLRHIHIEDGFGPEEANGQLRRRVLFRRLVLNRHSTLVLPSRQLVNLAATVWKIESTRTRYIPNGIHCARFRRARDVGSTFAGSGPIIGTVAALRREKALGRLIEAFTLLRTKRDARLVVVGEGPERARLEQMVHERSLDSSITFTGGLDRPEVALAAFDIFVLSSDTEQMPLSVLEAMAAGLPVVGTDVGDVRIMVAAVNDAFIVPRDACALADAARRLLDDPDLRAQVGTANRTRAAAEFDEARMFAAYADLFLGRLHS